MATGNVNTTWLDACRDYCKRIKYLGEHLTWDERPNHSDTLCAQSMLLDTSFVAIPRLTFSGEYRLARYGVMFRCKVMYRDGKDVFNVFRLEVYPKHKVSHQRGSLVIRGSHVHLGDDRKGIQIVRPAVCRLDPAMIAQWIERFRRHARILDNDQAQLVGPFEGDLF